MRDLKKLSWIFFLALVLPATTPVGFADKLEPPQAPVENTEARDQRWMERKLRQELIMLPHYSVFDELSFRLDGDAVELFGQVTSPALKQSAQRVVERTEGVLKVVNRIEVLPNLPGDDQIRLAVYRSLYNEGSRLFPYSLGDYDAIGIIVKRGIVTLVGAVNSEADRNFAYFRARAVPGVFSVTNKLVVDKH